MKHIIAILLFAVCTFAGTVDEKNVKIDIFRISNNGTLSIRYKSYSDDTYSNSRFSVPVSSPLYMPVLALSKEAMKNDDYIHLKFDNISYQILEIALHKAYWN